MDTCREIAKCMKCGRGFVWLPPTTDHIDHFRPPLIKDGRRKVPMFKGKECGGKIVVYESDTPIRAER